MKRLPTRLALTRFVVAAVLALPAITLSPDRAGAQVSSGWSVVQLPGLTEYHLYVPPNVDPELASPLVVFLHGGGSAPTFYRNLLSGEADLLSTVLALPQASSALGWGAGQDQALVEATISSVQSLLAIDPSHVSIAGHSAGGAFAYLLAYGAELPVSSVFTLGAPFLALSSVAGTYVPPIRMLYGAQDPNHESALPQLVDQWTSLEVPFEVDEVAGAGHNDLPTLNLLAGFDFMLANNRPAGAGITCATTDEQLCLVGGRFKVTVAFTDANGAGVGRVAEMSSDGSGLFWFYEPLNWEMLVKVLDGCNFNQKFWVLVAASTDVAYTVTVTDLETGTIKTYGNQLGTAAPAVVDLDAFATCSAG